MSNYLEVPAVRRDSYKSGTWDFVLREKSQDEFTNQESSSTGETLGESGKEGSNPLIVLSCSDPYKKVDFYTTLIKEACHIPGDAGELVTFSEISWIDKSLVQDSVVFHKKYYAHEIFAMAMSIVFGFAVKPCSSVLRRDLQNPTDFYQRQISILTGILKFFDFHKKPDEAYDEILKIRQMYIDAASIKKGGCSEDYNLKLYEPWKKAVVAAVKKDLQFINTPKDCPKDILLTWDSQVALSQLDMVTTQLGFWVVMWMFPKFFGIKNKAKEMQGVIHVWAIFGRLLGIKDEYNVCLKSGDSEGDLYGKLYRNMILESMKAIDETVVTMQHTFMQQFNQRVPVVVTYKSVLYFGLRQQCGDDGYKGNHLWKLMTWRDKLSVKFLQLVFLLMRYSMLFRTVVNYLLYVFIQLQALLYLPSKNWRVQIPQYLRKTITLKLY